ncbi:archaetidylserine decarboxylase [Paludisphaera mucosa]|uniref:phosphatidylserine decarboxylase n=1 Tax=Paludisphaera mucosa TaxID=3030827 RepID=A0ABT6FAZ1_9BACT|nr:archaetidylserine decarboxylase [Paludisphaera mucosa]MDG3004697.1 archaetidylserine decarboxylase [Paludisphaera mucosa]
MSDVGPPPPGPSRWSIRREQFRQARRIHGGLPRLALAVAAVRMSRLPIPSRRLRLRLFRDAYARLYPPGLDEGEAERPLDEYRSFNALFTRGLRPERRPVPAGTPEWLSPCDGTVQDVGRVERGRILTVKGIAYSAASLLACDDLGAFEGGRFAIVFLSPIDCHRVFSPMDGRVDAMTHVPGSRLLVHPPFQRPEFPVYTLNERMIFRLSGPEGSCAVVMVAGWGVGDVTSPLAPTFRPRRRRIDSHRWDSPAPVGRGEWIGTFGLGSTVVLITSATPSATPLVSPDDKVRYGQPLFRFDHAAGPR